MGGRLPKFNYESKDFLQTIEDLARKGLTDESICKGLVAEYGMTLNRTWFSELKNEKNKKGEPTKKAKAITEALARGRSDLVQMLRSSYLKSALGGKKTKDVIRQYAEWKCECGGSNNDCPLCHGTGKVVSETKAVVQEIERELPPNIQAQNTLLFDYDPEWKKMIIESKRMDITSGGEKISPARVLTKKEAKELLDDMEKDF